MEVEEAWELGIEQRTAVGWVNFLSCPMRMSLRPPCSWRQKITFTQMETRGSDSARDTSREPWGFGGRVLTETTGRSVLVVTPVLIPKSTPISSPTRMVEPPPRSLPRINNAAFAGNAPTPPYWTGLGHPLASLTTSLHTTFPVVPGKQPLNRYVSTDDGGATIERNRTRQRKHDDIVAWR